MKLLNKTIYLVALTAAALTLVGCKKGLQGTTPLPGYQTKAPDYNEKPPPPLDVHANDTNKVARTALDPNAPGIPLSTKLSDWVPSAEQPFKTDTVYFEYDKSSIKDSEISKLEKVANAMKQQYKGKGLRIEGHCDERGTEEYNRSLGNRRALSIREFLVRSGVSAEMVDVVSYGEDRPAESGHTESVWSKNRRGEFVMLEPPK